MVGRSDGSGLKDCELWDETMGDRSQDQEMKDMGGDGQQTQAGRDAIALQNSQMTINRSFISLFGDRPTALDVDWKSAKTILKDQIGRAHV